MAFSCCFSFKGDLDFLDFLLKSFITSTTGHHQKSTTRFRIKLKILDTVSSDSIRWRRWCCAALHTSTKTTFLLISTWNDNFANTNQSFQIVGPFSFNTKRNWRRLIWAARDVAWRCVTLAVEGELKQIIMFVPIYCFVGSHLIIFVFFRRAVAENTHHRGRWLLYQWLTSSLT